MQSTVNLCIQNNINFGIGKSIKIVIGGYEKNLLFEFKILLDF